MPNTNLVVTDGVTGDISSCKTEVSVIQGTARPNLFTIQSTGYATNNCTGETDMYQSYEPSGISYTIIVFAFIIGILITWKLLFDRW